MALNNFSSAIKKVVTKKYKNVSENFFVVVESEGIKNNKGFYYRVNNDNMILYGLVMFNALNPQALRDVRDSWNPIFNKRIQGKAGVGILVRSSATTYSEIFPIDATTITEFKNFKGLTETNERYCGLHNASWWREAIENTFEPSDFEKLVELYNKKAKSFGTVTKEYKRNPEGYDKQKWIANGYPCAYRYGFSWKGARAERIDNNSAKEKLNKVFESKYEMLKGVWHLVLQDYSSSDLY